MSNRVLLNNSALKVSRAGVDVLTANPSQLLFSSEWAALGVVQSGVYNISSSSWSGTANNRQHNGTIPLIKTFSSFPFCAFFLPLPDGAMTPIGFGSAAVFGGIRTNSSAPSSKIFTHFQVGNSNIAVRAWFTREENPSLAVPVFAFRYFVFDYNT